MFQSGLKKKDVLEVIHTVQDLHIDEKCFCWRLSTPIKDVFRAELAKMKYNRNAEVSPRVAPFEQRLYMTGAVH